jgi:hypothetical protein
VDQPEGREWRDIDFIYIFIVDSRKLKYWLKFGSNFDFQNLRGEKRNSNEITINRPINLIYHLVSSING